MLDFFKLITFFGSAYFLIGISVLLVLIIKNKKTSLSISLNLLLVFLFNQGLKQIFKMPRPDNPLVKVRVIVFHQDMLW